MTTSHGGSPSFATLEKKNKEMTMSQGGSLSFATPKKKRIMSLLTGHHLLHLKKKHILVIIFYT